MTSSAPKTLPISSSRKKAGAPSFAPQESSSTERALNAQRVGRENPSSNDRRAEAEMEFAPYRSQTIWLLRRYFLTSLQIGRLPGILGREFFRARVSSRRICSFEDDVIFATDFDHFLSRLDPQEQQLLNMLIFEEYDQDQVADMTGLAKRHVRRIYFRLLDTLTRMLLEGGYLRPIPGHEAAENLVKSRKIPKRG